MTGEHLLSNVISPLLLNCVRLQTEWKQKTSPTAPINTSKETNKHAAMHNRACKRITSKGLC